MQQVVVIYLTQQADVDLRKAKEILSQYGVTPQLIDATGALHLFLDTMRQRFSNDAIIITPIMVVVGNYFIGDIDNLRRMSRNGSLESLING